MSKITKGYPALMPTYEGQVGEEQILQIIAYLKTLGTPGGGR
jgi:cytochrome c oxidase subunit 2